MIIWILKGLLRKGEPVIKGILLIIRFSLICVYPLNPENLRFIFFNPPEAGYYYASVGRAIQTAVNWFCFLPMHN